MSSSPFRPRDGNDVVRKFFVTKVFDVIANLMAQLSQPASRVDHGPREQLLHTASPGNDVRMTSRCACQSW